MANGEMKLLHSMIRVRDLQKSVDFYRGALGMREVRRIDVPEGKYTLVYLGYTDEFIDNQVEAQLELTYNYGVSDYELGNAFGHFGVLVPDAAEVCERTPSAGGRVIREPGPVKFGTRVIAFIEDPDGFKIELIQRK
jgi:lactoylglutathione lyase